MKIVIEGSPEEIERILRKLAPRERRTQLAPSIQPGIIPQPYIGPQVNDPITPFITYPHTGIPTYPWGTITSNGVAPLTVGEGVAPLTFGEGVAPLTVGCVTQH